MLFAGKINTFRTIALLLIFLGFSVMYIGLLWPPAVFVFMGLGLLFFLLSTAIYVWIGTLSSNAPRVVCPRCGKVTKVLGMTDRCMFCKTTLTFDKTYATERES